MIPESVAIIGMGLSNRDYFMAASVYGGRHKIAEEVWAINAMGGIIDCDRIFMMDDFDLIKRNTEFMGWVPNVTVPLYTSRADKEACAKSVEFPLQEVVQRFGGMQYFNNTVAYVIAYAIYIGVKRLLLFGLDYTYTDKTWSETGRGCTEFWLGMAQDNGVKIEVAESSTMLGTNEPKFYGYQDEVTVETTGDGVFTIKKTPRENV